MKLAEAVDLACQKPTLLDALEWIAVWETDRAVKQALEYERTGVRTASHDGTYDTCFRVCFEPVIERYKFKESLNW